MGSFIKLLYFALLPIVLANDYCAVCSDHTMCRFTIKNPACGKTSEGGVSPSEAKQIVDLHNSYRKTIADGQETRGISGKSGFQRPAGNMKTLVWDEKLAEVAQRWADQCTFQHDQCRNDPRFEVGQNIYLISGFGTVNWTRAIDSWYREKDFSVKDMNSFKPNKKTTRFSQNAWATTTHIGCGRTTYNGAYRPYEYRPQEFILSEIPSRSNSAKIRVARQGKIGFFGGAKYDPSGSKGAITSSSKDISVNTGSSKYWQSEPNGGSYLNNGISHTRLHNLGFFGGAIFNPFGAQGAITASPGELFKSTGSLGGKRPLAPFEINFLNNGIGSIAQNNPGFFGGATFNPEGALGAKTATSTWMTRGIGLSSSNQLSRLINGYVFSSSNYPSINGYHPTKANYPNYHNYQSSGNGLYYLPYADFPGNYPRGYDFSSGSYLNFHGHSLMNIPAGSVQVITDDLSDQKQSNPWILSHRNLMGKDHMLVCNYGPVIHDD